MKELKIDQKNKRLLGNERVWECQRGCGSLWEIDIYKTAAKSKKTGKYVGYFDEEIVGLPFKPFCKYCLSVAVETKKPKCGKCKHNRATHAYKPVTRQLYLNPIRELLFCKDCIDNLKVEEVYTKLDRVAIERSLNR